ncbi:hypothetical protein UPYG_G00147000 [Umbra pygmaea]|uniref:Ig-like domain-containing protein n=1 Tax=Umbra pygmaea TaxID=75934 RepID=A0ABD0XLC7_UMBPY
MCILIWTTVLLTVLTTSTGPAKLQGYSITLSPAEITVQTGLCAAVSCTFNHPDYFYPEATLWLKCAEDGTSCLKENLIVHSNTNSKVMEDYRQRVSLLEKDLTKKNCSVIINNIRKSDEGYYALRLSRGYTYTTKKVKITVEDLTQKPSVMTPALTEGEPATLTCTAPGFCSGRPPIITWTWRGPGDNITELTGNTTTQKKDDLTNVTMTHISTLTFTPSAKHHGTNVTCQVTFNEQTQTEETVTLNVSCRHVILNDSGCVMEVDVMTCVCKTQGEPLPVITWPLLNVFREYSLTTSVSGSSVISTIILPVRTHTNITVVECISNHVGGVMENMLTVIRTDSKEQRISEGRHVILNDSGCVMEVDVMTCVCKTQGEPLPVITWPLLNVFTEYNLTTSVSGSSVINTIILPVWNNTNITVVECISNHVGGVMEKMLTVRKTDSKEQQKGQVEATKTEGIMAMLVNTNLIIAFGIGAAFSASICSIFLCLAVKCKRHKERIPKDSDCKHPGVSLEVVTSEDQLMEAGPAVGVKLIHLCEKLNRGAETGGPQTSAVVEQPPSGQEPNDVNYASINYSLLNTTPDNIQKTTESDYAEIKRENQKEGLEDKEESRAVMEEEEVEKEEEEMNEEKEYNKLVGETDEDTVLYSNMEEIMVGN